MDNVAVHGQSTTASAVGDSGKPLSEAVKVTSNNLHVAEQGNIAGLRNPSSETNAFLVARQECNVTICDGTSAVAIGGGAVGDTHLIGILILKNAGPATATIAGFKKKNNSGTEAAQSIVFTGSTADDRYVDCKGAINDAAALTVTANVDETVLVFWRPV